MLHSLHCRCFLRVVTSPKCSLLCSIIEHHNCAMSDKSQHGHKTSSRNTHRSQSFDFHSAGAGQLMDGNGRQYLRGKRSSSAHRYLNSLASEYYHNDVRSKEDRDRQRYCLMRQTEYTKLGQQLKNREIQLPPNSVKFTVFSYNVLAQDLLEQHMYLYRGLDREVLHWENRAKRLLREFRDSKADIICLQEIQYDHYEMFYLPSLKRMGFQGIFKKRTGDKPDGCAILYRTSKFYLRESISVEYCKPDVKLLDRDNIGLIALLSPCHLKSKQLSEAPFFCVATTHLLYNPRRHDIKLAQLQLLFAELDKIAFDHQSSSQSHSYHPVILTGDFNLTPASSIYRFITGGSIKYEGLSKDLVVSPSPVNGLQKELIPPHVKVTDQCQHLQVVETRTIKSDSSRPDDEDGEVQEIHSNFTFSSGQLSHKLKFKSAYPHYLNRLNGAPEVTTYQKDWVTVDYIFHSQSNEGKPSLTLLSRLGLLTGSEVDSLGRLPNLATPSDHLPLLSTFCWQYELSDQPGK